MNERAYSDKGIPLLEQRGLTGNAINTSDYSQEDSPEQSIHPQTPLKKSAFTNQTRALLFKSADLQWSQKGTNCCQIITPLFCLAFVYIIKSIAESQIGDPQQTFAAIPYLLNIPIWYILKTFGVKDLPLRVDTCSQWYSFKYGPMLDDEGKQFIGANDAQHNWGNLLPNLITIGCGYGSSPYFAQAPTNKTMNQFLYDTVVKLNQLDLKTQVKKNLDILPDGAVTFNEANWKRLNLTLQINDLRIADYHRVNGATRIRTNRSSVMIVPNGQLQLFDMLSQSYLRVVNNSTRILTGIQAMPPTQDESTIILAIINLVGGSLYPFALSILLPVYMFTLVLEKEERLREMMKMNGMQMKYYWMVNYAFFVLLYLVAVSLFYLFGLKVLDISFFKNTGFGVMSITLFGWGLSQTSLAIFFQNFLSKARYATILGYLLAVWTVIVALTLNYAVYPSPATLPFGYTLYPAFSFCRLLYILANSCSNSGCIASFSQFTPEMTLLLINLYFGAILFLFLGVYLNEILPQEYGVPRHPLFIFKSCRRRRTSSVMAEESDEHMINASEAELAGEDSDCKEERNFVMNIHNPGEYPLVINNIRKVYPGEEKKVAVKSFCLAIRPGETFGLLGPNGAGKTTIISMLTGLYPPTAGDASVAGFGILDNIDQVHMNMGVCPQFDLLWPELTVRAHLLFYARMRGVPGNLEEETVERAISEVYLTNFKDFKARQLSGGMKRRLSVAIALVGDPKIVFLDEPTTGLDPENRRQLWDILTESRGKRAMVLTTHSMEEADVLCNRIGIIAKGVLRCIGPQVRLKTLYGGGYHLSVNCHKGLRLDKNSSASKEKKEGLINLEEREEDEILPRRLSVDPKSLQKIHHRVVVFIQKILPGTEIRSCFNGSFEFKVPLDQLQISALIDQLESKKDELEISDWGISQSSLEDVFIEIVTASEENE